MRERTPSRRRVSLRAGHARDAPDSVGRRAQVPIRYTFVLRTSKPIRRYRRFAASRDGREVSSTVRAPAAAARTSASRVSASPTPRPRASSSTTTSSIHARTPLGTRKVARVSIPTIRPPDLPLSAAPAAVAPGMGGGPSSATRSVVPGAARSASRSSVLGGGALESCGKRRRTAASTSASSVRTATTRTASSGRTGGAGAVAGLADADVSAPGTGLAPSALAPVAGTLFCSSIPPPTGRTDGLPDPGHTDPGHTDPGHTDPDSLARVCRRGPAGRAPSSSPSRTLAPGPEHRWRSDHRSQPGHSGSRHAAGSSPAAGPAGPAVTSTRAARASLSPWT